MKTMILATLVTLSTLTSVQALAIAVNGAGSTVLGTSAMDGGGSHISAEYHKLTIAAKSAEQDLYYFQASNGEVVTANLLNSINTAQSLHPEWNDQQAIEALIGAL